MVGLTAFLNIPLTNLITILVLLTHKNNLYTYNLYVKKYAPMVGLTALLNIPPTYLITTLFLLTPENNVYLQFICKERGSNSWTDSFTKHSSDISDHHTCFTNT